MTRSSRWSSIAVLAATAAIVFAACGGTTASTAPSATAAAPSASAAASASASAPAFDAINYPATGEAPCGTAPYAGEFKKISAPDARTVVFDLCGSDVAFLSKIAFSSFAINDAGWLASHIDPAATEGQKIVSEVNGTGAYKLKAWNRGQDVSYEAYDGYWGTKALTPSAILRWNKEAAQRLVELQAGTVDGIDNVGPTDFATVEGDSSLALKPRTGLNVFYLGFNNTFKPWDNEKVRQAIAKGIDRKRIVDTFYPGGSEVADYFTPCAIPNGCVGPKWYDFDAAAAKAELTAAGFDFSKTYKLQFRAAVRGYLPDPPQIATEIQGQLKTNLGINTTLDLQESGAFLDANAAGTLDGIFMLGWGADYPDPTNFLDYHFGSGSGKKFGAPLPDIAAALTTGATTLDEASRKAAYTEANNLIKQHVPAVIIAHGASGTAFKADVAGAHSSPLGTEIFAAMQAADRDTLVWMQNAEPLSLFCPDETDGETLRACEQVFESLYSYKLGGTEAVPALAESCTPNNDASVWTCKLRDNVKFHDGASLDANDVVVTYASQWDTKHPLHIGRTSAFEYWSGLWGGNLNPPPPAP